MPSKRTIILYEAEDTTAHRQHEIIFFSQALTKKPWSNFQLDVDLLMLDGVNLFSKRAVTML